MSRKIPEVGGAGSGRGWTGTGTEPKVNEDLEVYIKYIELILIKWNACDPGELLVVDNWRHWVAAVAKSEGEVDRFRDKAVLKSFAEVLVELICDEGQQHPWRHKMLCSKLNDGQMEELSRLIEKRGEEENDKLLAEGDDDKFLGEEPCWNPVLEWDDDEGAGGVGGLGSRSRSSPDSDLLFADISLPNCSGSRKRRQKNKVDMKLLANGKPEVGRGNPMRFLRTPPHSPPTSSGSSGVRESLNEGLEREVALKYPKPSEDAPELTPEMMEMLKQALQRSKSAGECLVELNGLKYTRGDLAVLNDGREWLNDRNIDFYLELIRERSGQKGYLKVFVFHCFFFKMLTNKDCSFEVLRETTGDKDLAGEFPLVLFPINLHDHWRLVLVDFREKMVKCFDSLREKHEKENKEIMKIIMKYLTREFQKRSGKDPLKFFEGWSLQNVENIPQQGNMIDCGVFLLQFAEYLSRDKKQFDFEQKHMPYFRKKIMYETLIKRILT